MITRQEGKMSLFGYIGFGFMGVLVAFFLVAGFSYFFLTSKEIIKPLSFSTESTKTTTKEEPKIAHPITGELFTEADAQKWSVLKPLGVMVNNHPDARPQSGLIYADIVYEVVAEGGITRFLAFFHSNTPVKVGPVRSTREYYLTLVKEMDDAMLMHIGFSPQAEEAISTWPVKSLGVNGGDFWRDNPRNVATEHTAYTNTVELRKVGESLGWETPIKLESWKFKDDTPSQVLPSDTSVRATNITVDFWYPGDFTSMWKYNSEKNSYLRYMGYDEAGNPIVHRDQDKGQQIEVKNVIVQFAEESSVAGDEKNRLEYEIIGSGEAIIFRDGIFQKGTWRKASRLARTRFYDLANNEIEFNRGKFWVSIVPSGNKDLVVFN